MTWFVSPTINPRTHHHPRSPAVDRGTLCGWWKLRLGSRWVRAAQISLKPPDDKEAELVLKGSLINEQDNALLRVLLSYFSSHFPSKEMSLLDPSLAARSESQRHRFSAASPNFSGGFPHPCSFTQHVTNLVRGLLESSQAQDKLESNICSSKSPGNHRERQAWRTSPLGLTQSPSLPSLYPPSQLCG